MKSHCNMCNYTVEVSGPDAGGLIKGLMGLHRRVRHNGRNGKYAGKYARHQN